MSDRTKTATVNLSRPLVALAGLLVAAGFVWLL